MAKRSPKWCHILFLFRTSTFRLSVYSFLCLNFNSFVKIFISKCFFRIFFVFEQRVCERKKENCEVWNIENQSIFGRIFKKLTCVHLHLAHYPKWIYIWHEETIHILSHDSWTRVNQQIHPQMTEKKKIVNEIWRNSQLSSLTHYSSFSRAAFFFSLSHFSRSTVNYSWNLLFFFSQ